MRYRIVLGIVAWLIFVAGCLKPRHDQSPFPPSPLISPLAIRFYLPTIANRYDPRYGVTIQGACQDVTTLRAAWFHTWGWDDCALIPGFVDMAWDEQDIGDTFIGYYVLGFNEPDLPSQADMTPCQGAAGWRTIEMSNTLKYLVSPVPSQLTPDWLWGMVNCYWVVYDGERPRFDAIQAHYYYWPGQPTISEYLDIVRAGMQANGYGNRPIWLTEFGVCPTLVIDQAAWLRETVAWIKSQPDIARFAWYSNRQSSNECQMNLIEGDGMPSNLGIEYIGTNQ